MATPISDALAELRSQFASQLSARLEVIHAHVRRMESAGWQSDVAEALHRLVHGLTGLAGTFGMPSVSDAARMLESRLAIQLKTGVAPTAEEWQAILGALGRLDHITHIRVQSNAPNLPVPPALPPIDHATLIHLVEDDPVQAEHLGQALRDDGYRVEVFNELEAFRAACIAPDLERPAVVVMDMVFPEGDVAGADLLVELKAQNAQCPPVVFASMRDDMPARLAALRAGASRYLVKPVDPSRLIELLDALTGRQPPLPYRILIVDDDPLVLAAHAAVLRAAGMEVYPLSQPLQILDVLNTFAPDVVVLDVYMPEASGPELAAALRERDALQQLPILFLSSEVDMSQQLLALNLGGDDFLVKPVQPDHLIAAVTGRARRARQSATIRQHLDVMLYEREREHLALNQHAIVSITDQAGNITYVNDKFCEISGYSRNELLGQNHRIVKSGEHPPAFYQNLWDTITDGRVWEGEICNRRKDGSLYWVESSITPFLDADGMPYQYVSIRTDISRMKSVEVALRASESRFRDTLNQAPALIWVADTENKGTWYNRRWLEYTGRTLEQEIGLGWAEGIHPDDRDRCMPSCQHAFEERRPFDIEFRLRRADGSYGWLAVSGIPRFSAEGVFEGYIGYCWDISSRKQAEQAAEAHKDRLRRGQLFANVGTWDWHIQTGELYWSERIATLFGYAEGELETSYDNFLAAIHPDDRQSVIDAVNACIERDVPYEIEHRVVWPNGTVRWLLERGAVLRDADGKPVQMLGVVQDVDDRKRAELALSEREQQLREAQTLARIGNWTADMASGRLIWSDEIYRIFGHEPGSFAPSVEAFHAAVYPDDRIRVYESEVKAQQTGRHDVVHRIVRPDGAIRHVHELAQAETNAAGKLVRLTGTVQDITEWVEAETRLRETEERFSFAVEGAGDGVWDWDMLTNAMQFSRIYMAMLGYAEHELPDHVDTWINRVHPDDWPRVQQTLQDYLAGRTPKCAVEMRLRCKDGGYKWILCRGTVVRRNAKGQPVRMIGIHSDIAEEKQGRQEVERFKNSLDRTLDCVFMFEEKSLRFFYANQGALNQVGYSREALLAMHPYDIKPDYPEPAFRELIAPLLCGQQVSLTFESVHQHKSGQRVPVEVFLQYFASADEPGHFVAIVRDITAQKATQQALIAARDEADRASRSKTDFLSSMSHELRTPMNAILGFGQLMEYDESLPAEHRDSVQEILKAGHHLLELINEVLDLAKVESGRIDLSLEPLDLCSIVEECLSLIRPLAGKRNVQLSHARLEGVKVRGDRTRLKQALLNLLSNAVKYNREGGQVHIDARAVGTDRMRILISDSGLGIPAERLRELFQPFSRLDAEHSDIEGTGIGLAFTQRIVEMMGGSVGVDSKTGEGSVFWIELPLESPELGAASASGGAGSMPAPNKDEAQHVVLYIEDNPANLRLVAQMLGSRPHIHLLTAHTPELGIELALARQPDLILLDINLPGMNGYQVLEVLRADARLRSVPVVAISANAMPDDIEHGKVAGFREYLTKPLDITGFFHMLDRCLSAREETEP